jgi:hypothetical protein
METLPSSHEENALSARGASTQARLRIQSVEIAVKRQRHDSGAEELELIEMRYRHALTLAALEDVFAEGQLDSQ